MALFLAVHARYKDVQLGLFKNGNLIESASDESKKISKNFLILLEGMLKNSRHTFEDLAFVAAHQGPAPFTTLRVCLTTVNGLAFATGVPLIGVNGLQELVVQHKRADSVTVALLNAFSQEVYYGIDDPFKQSTSFGYAPAEPFLKELSERFTDNIAFVGNGLDLYDQVIKQSFGDRARLVSSDIVSLEAVAGKALELWKTKETVHQLMPIYLKEYALAAKA